MHTLSTEQRLNLVLQQDAKHGASPTTPRTIRRFAVRATPSSGTRRPRFGDPTKSGSFDFGGAAPAGGLFDFVGASSGNEAAWGVAAAVSVREGRVALALRPRPDFDACACDIGDGAGGGGGIWKPSLLDAPEGEALLLADVRLIYQALDGLDSPVEVVALRRSTGGLPRGVGFTAVVLSPADAAGLAVRPHELGQCLIRIPPPVPPERLQSGGDTLAIDGDSWWDGLGHSFTAETAGAPPSRALIETGVVRCFVLPVDGEPNVRRVLLSTAHSRGADEAFASRYSGCGAATLLDKVVAAASEAPPVGEWQSTLDASLTLSSCLSDSPADVAVAAAQAALVAAQAAATRSRAAASESLAAARAAATAAASAAAAANAAVDVAAAEDLLYPHQLRTVRWMRAVESGHKEDVAEPLPAWPELETRVALPSGGVVGSPPGAGKTRIALTLAASDGQSARTLVLCPPHLVEQWKVEMASVPGAERCVEIWGHDSISRVCDEVEAASAGSWTRLIVDEPQELSSELVPALRAFGAQYYWALCGTGRQQLRRCGAVAYGGSEPRWATIPRRPEQTPLPPGPSFAAVSLWDRLAARFVARRCVADSPADCLPRPAKHEHLIALQPPLSDAMRVLAHTRAGELELAVRVANGTPVPPVKPQQPARSHEEQERERRRAVLTNEPAEGVPSPRTPLEAELSRSLPPGWSAHVSRNIRPGEVYYQRGDYWQWASDRGRPDPEQPAARLALEQTDAAVAVREEEERRKEVSAVSELEKQAAAAANRSASQDFDAVADGTYGKQLDVARHSVELLCQDAEAWHSSFLAQFGLRCACDSSSGRRWCCSGIVDAQRGTRLDVAPAEAWAAEAPGALRRTLTLTGEILPPPPELLAAAAAVTAAAKRVREADSKGEDRESAELALQAQVSEALAAHDHFQGVDTSARDQLKEELDRVAKFEKHLRWAERAKDVLFDTTATCAICYETFWHKSVSLWPCLHLACHSCAERWVDQFRFEQHPRVPCPQCREPAGRSEVTQIAPRSSDGAQPLSKLEAAAKLIGDLLRSGSEERVVVFGQWAGMLASMASTLLSAGIAHLSLDATSLQGRLDALRRFGKENEPRVLLLSSERHASGINLQCARYVVLLHPHCPTDVLDTGDLQLRSLAEAAAYDAQAIGRVRRFPQTREVVVYRLYVQGTIEEELLAAQGVVS